MKLNAFLVIAYALFLLAGGLIGYIKHQSLMSIVTASGFAFCLIASAIAMLYGYALGRYTALALTFALFTLFSYRFYLKGQFMPGGLIALVSAFILLFLFLNQKK